MKTEKSIQKKLRQVRFRILKKEIRKNLSQKPCNCRHAGLVRGHASEPLFYVCLLDAKNPSEWEGMICDQSVPPTCPFFKASLTKEEVEERVNRDLNSGDMGIIASKYPDAAALLWVLAGIEDPNANDEEDEDVGEDKNGGDE